MRHLVAVLLVGLFLLIGVQAYAVTSTASDWYETEGEATLQSFAGSTFPDLTAEQLDNLDIGDPVAAVTVPENSADPRNTDASPEYFAAPVSSGDTPIGALTYHESDDGSGEGSVVADDYLATRLTTIAEGDMLLIDPDYDTYFIIRGDDVIPANTEALEYLAGATSVDSFLEWRQSLADEGPIVGGDEGGRNYRAVAFAGVILAVVLALTLIFTWLRHSPHGPQHTEVLHDHVRRVRIYRRGGNRVNADD